MMANRYRTIDEDGFSSSVLMEMSDDQRNFYNKMVLCPDCKGLMQMATRACGAFPSLVEELICFDCQLIVGHRTHLIN